MMNFTIDVRLSATPELLGAIRDLTAVFSGQTPTAKQAQKAVEKPVQKTEKQIQKTEPVQETAKVEEPAPVAEVATETAPEVVTETADEAVTYTIEQVRAAVSGKSKKVGKDPVKKLLAEFDTTSVTNMDEKHYAAFMAKVEAL